jgi:hypothetical protein
MPNVLNDIMPQILAQGLATLREECVMPNLVNSSYSLEASQRGQIIEIPVPTKMTAQDVMPGAVAPEAPDLEIGTVKIPLNRWKESAFYLTDKQMLEIMEGVPNMQLQEAARAVANTINMDLLRLYRQSYATVGTPGSNAFSNEDNIIAARKVLNKNLASRSDRRIVVDVEGDAQAVKLFGSQLANNPEAAGTIQTGEIGQKFGFQWFYDQLADSHIAGTIAPKTGVINVKTAPVTVTTPDPSGFNEYNPIKVNQVTLKGVTSGNVKAGDIFTVAGDPNSYVVTADATSAASEITIGFNPAPAVAWAPNTVVNFRDSHNVNLAFHRDAIALAIRPLLSNSIAEQELGGARVLQMADPKTGIPLRLEVRREYKRVRFAFDALWGSGVVRPEHLVRIMA